MHQDPSGMLARIPFGLTTGPIEGAEILVIALLYLLAQNPARIIIITGIAPKTDDLERENLAFQKSNLYQHHRKKQKRMGYTTEEQSLKSLVATFLADLAHANHSPQTYRFCATDLTQLCALHQGPILAITADVLRMFFERHVHLRPATRARKQAAVARVLTRAEHLPLLVSNPMRKIDRVKLDPQNLQTTLRYTEQADGTTDAEVRTWRRKHSQHLSVRED